MSKPKNSLDKIRTGNAMLNEINQMLIKMAEIEQETLLIQSELQQNIGQRQNVLETLIGQMHTAVIVMDENGRVRLINQAVKYILSLPENWSPFQNDLQTGIGNFSQIEKFYDELRQQDGSDLHREYCIQVGEGKARHIRVRSQSLDIDIEGLSGYIFEIDDVTKH